MQMHRGRCLGGRLLPKVVQDITCEMNMNDIKRRQGCLLQVPWVGGFRALCVCTTPVAESCTLLAEVQVVDK